MTEAPVTAELDALPPQITGSPALQPDPQPATASDLADLAASLRGNLQPPKPRGRPRGSGRRARAVSVGATKNAETAAERPTVLSAATDIASSGDSRARKLAPKAEEWEPYIAKAVSYASLLYLWWLLLDDDEDDAFDKYSNDLRIDDERASIIAKPIARLLAETAFSKLHGRNVIENGDILLAVIAIATYVHQTRPLLRAKLQRMRQSNSRNILSVHRAQTNDAPPAPPRGMNNGTVDRRSDGSENAEANRSADLDGWSRIAGSAWSSE